MINTEISCKKVKLINIFFNQGSAHDLHNDPRFGKSDSFSFFNGNYHTVTTDIRWILNTMVQPYHNKLCFVL